MNEVEKMRSSQLADMSVPEIQVKFEHAKRLLAKMCVMSTYDEDYRSLLEVFTLAPDRAAIESNINRALFLCDKSAYHYSQDLQEKGYYNRVVAGNINQQVQVDSVVCDFDTYPYRVTTYARQMIIRESNVTERSLVTRCNLINSVRSDNNPQGFTMERFEIVENRDLRVIAR